jgi:hypothetical protein
LSPPIGIGIGAVSRFFAETEEEGKRMEIYYLTMSKEICEAIGAVNDENYLIAIKLLAAYHGVRGPLPPTEPPGPQ